MWKPPRRHQFDERGIMFCLCHASNVYSNAKNAGTGDFDRNFTQLQAWQTADTDLLAGFCTCGISLLVKLILLVR